MHHVTQICQLCQDSIPHSTFLTRDPGLQYFIIKQKKSLKADLRHHNECFSAKGVIILTVVQTSLVVNMWQQVTQRTTNPYILIGFKKFNSRAGLVELCKKIISNRFVDAIKFKNSSFRTGRPTEWLTKIKVRNFDILVLVNRGNVGCKNNLRGNEGHVMTIYRQCGLL